MCKSVFPLQPIFAHAPLLYAIFRTTTEISSLFELHNITWASQICMFGILASWMVLFPEHFGLEYWLGHSCICSADAGNSRHFCLVKQTKPNKKAWLDPHGRCGPVHPRPYFVDGSACYETYIQDRLLHMLFDHSRIPLLGHLCETKCWNASETCIKCCWVADAPFQAASRSKLSALVVGTQFHDRRELDFHLLCAGTHIRSSLGVEASKKEYPLSLVRRCTVGIRFDMTRLSEDSRGFCLAVIRLQTHTNHACKAQHTWTLQ